VECRAGSGQSRSVNACSNLIMRAVLIAVSG
jgi:hypothetical protein